MTIRQYTTARAFKQALEARLKASSTSGADFARRRQLLVFERFLARVAQVAGDAVTLKGGLVLELRLARGRTTKDVDLRMMGSSSEVLARLQEAGRLDLSDEMLFGVQPDERHREMLNDGMRYEGYRYRAECRLAGQVYGRPFGVDVAFGDPLVGEPDIVLAEDTPASPGSLRRPCASIQSSPTLPRSSMRSQCLAHGPTRGFVISRISLSWPRPARSKGSAFAKRSRRPSSSEQLIRLRPRSRCRRNPGRFRTLRSLRRTSCPGRRCNSSRTQSRGFWIRCSGLVGSGVGIHPLGFGVDLLEKS